MIVFGFFIVIFGVKFGDGNGGGDTGDIAIWEQLSPWGSGGFR
jgi:hypothetical protein